MAEKGQMQRLDARRFCWGLSSRGGERHTINCILNRRAKNSHSGAQRTLSIVNEKKHFGADFSRKTLQLFPAFLRCEEKQAVGSVKAVLLSVKISLISCLPFLPIVVKQKLSHCLIFHQAAKAIEKMLTFPI